MNQLIVEFHIVRAMRWSVKFSSKCRRHSRRSISPMSSYRLHRLVDVVNQKPADPVRNNLGNRTVRMRDHWRSTSHGLDHDQPEGLGPFDRKQQGGGIPQELLLFSDAPISPINSTRGLFNKRLIFFSK